MLRSIGLSQTHMECRNLKDSVPVLTDLLAAEKVGASNWVALGKETLYFKF